MPWLKRFLRCWIRCVALHGAVTGLLLLWVVARMPSDGSDALVWALGPRDFAAWALWALLPLLGLFDAALPDALLVVLSSAAWGALLALGWTVVRQRPQPAVGGARTEGVRAGAG